MKFGVTQRKDDYLVLRIESNLKEQFTKINKQKNIKNSVKIRDWIEDYIQDNNKNKIVNK